MATVERSLKPIPIQVIQPRDDKIIVITSEPIHYQYIDAAALRKAETNEDMGKRRAVKISFEKDGKEIVGWIDRKYINKDILRNIRKQEDINELFDSNER